MTDTAPGASLYDRLGGDSAIMAAVDRFYQKVMEDELTRPFFAGLDMDAQIRKQISFMSWAFGGPERYKARDLRQAHEKLVRDRGLSDVHFDAVAAHLKATLKELGVEDSLVQEALAIVAGTRNDVLGR
jgi:hemoglobin